MSTNISWPVALPGGESVPASIKNGPVTIKVDLPPPKGACHHQSGPVTIQVGPSPSK